MTNTKIKLISTIPWIALAMVWIVISVYSCSADADGIDIGLGVGLFDEVPENRYVQREFENEYNRTTPTLKIGYHFDIDKWAIHAGLQYLGEMDSTAQAVSSDAVYSMYGSQAGEHWPMSTYMVNNKTYGLYALVTRNFGNLYLGGGAMYQYSRQRLQVKDWHYALDSEHIVPSKTSRDLDYKTTSKSIKPVIVIGYDFTKNLSLEYGLTRIGKANESQEPDDFVDINKGKYQSVILVYKF